jgi:hypothetical protein
MVRWLGNLAVVMALTLSLASPWALLQSLAWASMLAKFSRQASFTQAVLMTFDGQHACRLCKAIQTGKAQERKPSSHTAQTGADLKLFPPPSSFLLSPPPTPGVLPDTPVLPDARGEPPPTPPPRFA